LWVLVRVGGTVWWRCGGWVLGHGGCCELEMGCLRCWRGMRWVRKVGVVPCLRAALRGSM